MSEKYDENYQHIMEKLNDGSTPEKGEAEKNMVSSVEKTDGSQKKEKTPLEESKKENSAVKKMVRLDEQEKFQLTDIIKHRKLSYKQAIWRMVGEINTKKIMENYEKLMSKNEVLRTVYRYKAVSQPMKVVYESREKTFPIHDIRNLNNQKQNNLMKNILAAEARRECDLETDSPLRLQGFLVGDDEMMVVISLYTQFSCSMGMRDVLLQIFEGMRSDNSNVPVADEKVLQKMNDQLRDKDVNYWKKLLTPLGKSLAIPGENKENRNENEAGKKNEQEKLVLHQEINAELVGTIKDYCGKNGVSVKAFFLSAWGNLLGRFQGEENPVVAVAQKEEKMNVIPVTMKQGKLHPDRIKEIDAQLAQSSKYCGCSISDIEEAMGIQFREYFRVVHNFVEFDEFDDLEMGNGSIRNINAMSPEDTDINLFINYQILDKSIMLTYTSKGGINELMLDNLHEILEDELSNLFATDQTKFDKKTFIKMDDTVEEKLRKIRIAQIALYLKNTGIFGSISVEEIMKLAEYCKQKVYLSGDMVVTEKSKLSKLYILGEGKMEESRMAVDGMVKSLRIVKEGALFGVESLFEDGEACTTYTVVSPQVKIIEIENNIFTEVLRRKPEGWIALLQKEFEQKVKIQRLWTMV